MPLFSYNPSLFWFCCSRPILLHHQNPDHNSWSLQDKFCEYGMTIVTLLNTSFIKYIWILDKMLIYKIPFILINSARIPCPIRKIIFILFTTYLFSRSNTFGHALVGTWTRDLSLTKGVLYRWATRAILKWAGLDLNQRRQSLRIYSPPPLTTRAPTPTIWTYQLMDTLCEIVLVFLFLSR